MAALAVAPNLASAAPSSPAAQPTSKPTIASVQKQLGELAVRNSQLVEQFNTARIAVTKAQKAASVAQSSSRAAAASYARANVAFTRTVQAQYESGSMTTGGALLDSSSGNDYLSRLDTMRLLSTHDANVVQLVAKSRRVAAARASAAASSLATATSEQARLNSQKTTVAKQITKYRTLLSTLNSAQRAAYLRAANPTVSAKTLKNIPVTVTATTASARKAVQFALDQVGKPYVFGAAGPGSYDCSGLTMAAWQRGGVSLPHSAADQYNYGKHVSVDKLQPGDLIFMYQPIGHVTIYIGNGLMVSAPTEGENVSVVPVDAFSSDIVGATHLG